MPLLLLLLLLLRILKRLAVLLVYLTTTLEIYCGNLFATASLLLLAQSLCFYLTYRLCLCSYSASQNHCLHGNDFGMTHWPATSVC